MDWNAVASQLSDVPRTFQRSGTTYQWLMNAYTAGLLRYTSAADGTNTQLSFQTAVGNWLDVWGNLFNIARNNGEADGVYAKRIQFLLTRGKGTLVAIAQFIQTAENISATVTEQSPGYTIQLGSQSTSFYAQIASDLKYVRPAGVPFLPFQVLRGGLYLGTVDYLGVHKVTGAYLTTPVTPVTPVMSATTNNSTPLLPTTFLTDPTLNPGLAA